MGSKWKELRQRQVIEEREDVEALVEAAERVRYLMDEGEEQMKTAAWTIAWNDATGALRTAVAKFTGEAMSTLRACPKCHRKSLGGGPTWGRVWCLYAAEGACGYSAPLDMDTDVDDKQMTHSDEPTTTEERDEWRVSAEDEAAYLAGAFSPVDALRLITDVNRLEENAKFMRDDYSPVGARGCRLCVYEDGVFQRSCRLHQEIARLETKGCPQCPHCHPDSRWP